MRTVLIANVGTRNLGASQEKGAIAGLFKHGSHDCSFGRRSKGDKTTAVAGEGRNEIESVSVSS